MALVVKDRVKEVTTTTGTSNLTLGGAVYGFQSFSVIGNGNTTYYGIYDSATGDWEVGVGTYSTTGPTLTRDTVLESSNSGSKVVFGAGSKDVFVTYPAERSVYLDAAGSAVTVLDVGTLGVSTANISTANITAGTVSTTPTANTDIANKLYVDNMASTGLYYHAPVQVATTQSLAAQTGGTVTYNNGASGVGATLTLSVPLTTLDGYTLANTNRILVKDEANQANNGIYTWATGGTVLTRATDADSYGAGPGDLSENDYFFVQNGTVNKGSSYICSTQGTIVFGTTAITFAQFSTSQVYSAGAGLTLSGTTFSLTPVGTAGTYGSSSSVPVFTTNAYGQVTSVTNTGIAISAGAVSGLAPSATTDTTNASNITSGTLGSARLTGSYTGITGVGTLTAGTWNANTIGAAYGGTGITSYTVGDILYADGSTSLAKLADVATGNALLSGGVGTAPAWGKIGLQTHVSGTLQVVNGGTGATDATGARSNLGLVIGTDIPSVTGSGASGTWGINISGNAATATTATTSTTATQVSNSVTFNNSGTGAASGNGFNGSSALTVSYNTIGAPSTTGTNASGTWGISISGNAATASNASQLGGKPPQDAPGANTIPTRDGSGYTYFYYINSNTNNSENPTVSQVIVTNGGDNFYRKASIAHLTSSLSGTAPINITGSAGSSTTSTYSTYLSSVGSYVWNNATASTGYVNGISNAFVSAAEGFPSYGDVMTMNSYPGGGGALQLYSPYGSAYPDLNLRFRTADYSAGGAWTAWKIILDSANYNNYAPTLTGTGASGTWSINITGSAGSASSASSVPWTGVSAGARTNYDLGFQPPGSGYSGFYFSKSTSGPTASDAGYFLIKGVSDNFGPYTAEGITLVSDANSLNLFARGASLVAGGNAWVRMGTGTSETFRLQSDFSYALNSSRAPIFYDSDNTGYYIDPASTSDTALRMRGGALFGPNQTWGAYLYVGTNGNVSGTATVATTNGNLHLDPASGASTYLNYYAGSNVYFGNGASGGVYAQIANDGSFRSPIYYDYNNTAYYCDPAGFSNMGSLTLNGSAYFYPNNWIGLGGDYGIYNYSAGGNGAHFLANQSSSYGAWRTIGSRNGWAGIYDTYSAVNGMMYDGSGNGGVYREANGRWYFYYALSNDCMGIGTSSTSSTYSLYLTKGVYAQSRIDATIFYDTNNTGYYVDPASSSQFSLIYADNWFRAQGETGLYSSSYGQHIYAKSGGAYWGVTAAGNGNGGLIFYQSYESSLRGYVYWDGSGFGLLHSSGGWAVRTTPSVVELYNSVYAPIIYDSNNSGYYVDPNSNSRLNQVLADGGTFYGATYFQSNQNTTGSSPPLQAYSNNGSGAIMAFHRGGYYAVNMGLDSDNVIRIGGWSAAANRLQMDMSGNLTMAGSVTAFSDERLKKDWADLSDDFIERLASVKAGTYTRIDSGERQAGSSAQDWQELLPEVVSEDAAGTLALAYGNAAVVACVELAKSVVALRAEIKALRAQ